MCWDYEGHPVIHRSRSRGSYLETRYSLAVCSRRMRKAGRQEKSIMAFFLFSCIPYCLRLRVLSDLWSHNGWILFLLEHRAGHSPSAADRIGSTGLKTEHNSLIAKDLNW